MNLIVYPPAYGELNASPFCVKAMALLQMSGLDHAITTLADPRKQPYGKLPVLRDGDQVVPDSDGIRDYLETRYGCDFDAGLSDDQKAVSRMVIRALEEHLYFAILSERWLEDENWAVVRAQFFTSMPRPVAMIVAPLLRRAVAAQARGQGIGRLPSAERVARADKDFVALRQLLGGRSFLFGDTPTAADATAVAMLRSVMKFPKATPLAAAMARHGSLVAYMDRTSAAILPPLSKITGSG